VPLPLPPLLPLLPLPSVPVLPEVDAAVGGDDAPAEAAAADRVAASAGEKMSETSDDRPRESPLIVARAKAPAG
jgi:hypothetical protein